VGWRRELPSVVAFALVLVALVLVPFSPPSDDFTNDVCSHPLATISPMMCVYVCAHVSQY